MFLKNIQKKSVYLDIQEVVVEAEVQLVNLNVMLNVKMLMLDG
jgi:hypothetical protein